MINALHDSNITLLPHWVAVHVPSLERDGTPCKTDWTDKTARFLSSLFGGATVSYTSGYWRLATDKIQNEACSVVSSHAREIYAEDVQKIFKHLVKMKQACNQECVAIEVDGVMLLLDDDAESLIKGGTDGYPYLSISALC